jgi:HSP20 family molecular chaperone IbpA
VRLGNPANPPKVDGDAISAKLEDGVLVVEVPKTQVLRTRSTDHSSDAEFHRLRVPVDFDIFLPGARTFERKVRLGNPANPPKVDGDAISAKLEDGVLVVEVR